MSEHEGEIVIPLNKPRIALLSLGAIAFVVFSVLLWVLAEDENLFIEVFAKAVAILGFVFFGLCTVFGMLKLADNKPGLIITEAGIQDNSSAVSGHFIRWTEIIAIEPVKVKQSRFILIFVRNPRRFMESARPFKRWWLARNQDMYSTPLSISSVSLNCSFEELLKLIENNRKTYEP